MAVDLRIRPLGRPKITKDSALGFQRVSRRYVVEGRKVTKDGLDGIWDGEALFRPVGEADEEFANHFLVNQHIEPSKTVDKAYLTRDYAEIRNTWSAESVTESGDLKRITRRYAVLRNQSALGYPGTLTTGSWGNHPAQQPALGGQPALSDHNDPWDYLPQVITDTTPVDVSYRDTAGNLITAAGLGNMSPFLDSNGATLPVHLDTGPAPVTVDANGVAEGEDGFDANTGVTPPDTRDLLGDAINAGGNVLEWVRASAQVDMSNPGIDMWSVSWVAPVSPNWSVGSGGKGSSTPLPSTVHFDTRGMKIFKFGSSGGGVQNAHAFTYYAVGESIPPYLLPFASSGGRTPSVSMDFYLVGLHGNHGSQSFKQTLTNTIYDKESMQANLKFPSMLTAPSPNVTPSDGLVSGIQVAHGNSGEFIFEYPTTAPLDPNTFPPGGYPTYQGNPIIKAGGHITWTQGYTAGQTALARVSIKPIFSHNLKKIWKVTLVYVS